MFSITLLYAIIAVVLGIAAFVIVYHILRYSLSEALGYGGAIIFTAVFLALASFNYFSFQSLENETEIPTIDTESLLEAPNSVFPTKRNNPW
jgi:hypothetical protein